MRKSLLTITVALLTVLPLLVVLAGLPGGTDEASAHDGVHDSEDGWSNRCLYNNSGYYDPIVYPDQQPAGHRHDFFGGDVTKDSTYEQLRAGDTSCAFINDPTPGDDKSGYWVPSLRTQNGVTVEPYRVNAYYRVGPGVNAHDVEPFPAGLKIIARDNGENQWSQGDVRWSCGSDGNGSNNDWRQRPYNCTSDKYDMVVGEITFPNCSDGRVDSPLSPHPHQTHMDYSTEEAGCPKGFTPVPRINLRFRYYTSHGGGAMLMGGGGHGPMDPGTEYHADFFEAWEPGEIRRLIEECMKAGIECRLDGDSDPGDPR